MNDAGAGGSGAAPARANGRARRPTATSRFGVSRRESHDASEFYERFPAPRLSDDETVVVPTTLDEIWVGDARAMDEAGDIADGSVALVVTSPPYFAGKEYETAVGEGHVPASYIAYVEMLRGVFAECFRKLEPGGRIAVNVANLGRKPYRSLSADVIDVLQELGFLLRGEIVWIKGKAAGGSCAWGSFQRPGNPVFRDLSERIIVASKGRFDRAVPARKRAGAALPSVATISADEFMELTTDVWELPPESATRVGHPAPFPVELPRRLIDLYTYEGDLVLDPFMGSGSTAVAALRTGRHYIGFDTDPAYVDQAEARLDHERSLLTLPPATGRQGQDGSIETLGATGRAPSTGARPPAPSASPGRRNQDVSTETLGASGRASSTGARPPAPSASPGHRNQDVSTETLGASGRASSTGGPPPGGARLVRVPVSVDAPGGRRRVANGAPDAPAAGVTEPGNAATDGTEGRGARGARVRAASAVEVAAVEGSVGEGQPAIASGASLGLGDEVEQAIRAGRKAKDVAALMLAEAGFEAIESTKTLKVAGLPVDLRARDQAGRVWIFDVVAGFAASNPGLRRADTLWRSLGKASALSALVDDLRYVLFTIDLPLASTPPARALAAVQGTGEGQTITDVIRLLDAGDVARLRTHAGRG